MQKSLIIALLINFCSINSYSQQKPSSTRESSRSAKNGQYVTKSYADKHKSTTYTSKIKKSKKSK